MLLKYLIWYSKVAKQENHLPVKVALTVSGAANNLQEEILSLKLELAGSKLYHFFSVNSELRLVTKNAFGSTQSYLISRASHDTKLLINDICQSCRDVPTAICKGIVTIRIVWIILLLSLHIVYDFELVFAQFSNELSGSEALTSSCVHL